MTSSGDHSIEALNARVTYEIHDAELLDAEALSSASAQAWANVSATEEELASSPSINATERSIAERGAVRSALRSGNEARAAELAQRFRIELY